MTDYVIMPKADYQSVCDLIRSKSGKTAPILSGQLKSEIEALLREAPGEEPGVEIKKLSAPVIRLEEVGGEEIKKLSAPVIRLEAGDIEYTPSVLGVAVLGRTKLGDAGDSLPTLTAPVIRLETVTDGSEEPEEPAAQKLDAPVISLETVAEDNEEPEEPVVQKLDAPVIELVEG